MRRLVVPFALMLSCACTYENAARSGPLVTTADSLISRHERLQCRQEEMDAWPEGTPAQRECVSSDRWGRWMQVGRWGRVLAITVNWPDDSAGQLRAQGIARQWTAAAGAAPEAGRPHDGTTLEEWHWRTPTTCFSMYRGLQLSRERRFSGYQVSWSLPERFGRAHCD